MIWFAIVSVCILAVIWILIALSLVTGERKEMVWPRRHLNDGFVM